MIDRHSMLNCSDSGNFTRFQEIVSTQPVQWQMKLYQMYENEPDVAIAAWTLISSMENLDIEQEEMAVYLKKLDGKR